MRPYWLVWPYWASFSLAHYTSDREYMVLLVESGQRLNALESFLISSGFLKSYRDLGISKVQYLAVIDSEEAARTIKVLRLLRWLEPWSYWNKERVLKKSKEALTLCLKSEKISKETTSDPLLEQKYMSLEVISFSDGKHAVAKAANFLLEKHYSGTDKPNLTESDMTVALGVIGYGEPEPDLMLIYGPARCHLGFPAWRIRYAEMEYMGPLKCMKFGSLVKAIYRFTRVRQNTVNEWHLNTGKNYIFVVEEPLGAECFK